MMSHDSLAFFAFSRTSPVESTGARTWAIAALLLVIAVLAIGRPL